jgi:hypothetical protein
MPFVPDRLDSNDRSRLELFDSERYPKEVSNLRQSVQRSNRKWRTSNPKNAGPWRWKDNLPVFAFLGSSGVRDECDIFYRWQNEQRHDLW